MKVYHVIGLMSGTSLDGLDIAYCKIQKTDNQWNADILKATTIQYPISIKKILSNLENASAQKYVETDIALGRFFGEKTSDFIIKNNLKINFIASHGHTIFHQPNNRIYSQIGYGGEIYAQTKIPVICDFRGLDIALGGQGAPLVPIGDQLLFSKYDFCLNLGGIVNISFDHEHHRVAFDICIANMGLNYLAQQIGLEYDKGGTFAHRGHLESDLFHQLNADKFYEQKMPKSLGKEWFNASMRPILEHFPSPIENKLHTLCKHIAFQIRKVLVMYNTKRSKILITGGGALNTFLMSQIKQEIPHQIEIVKADEKLIHYKEALIFAFLGVLRHRNEINCLKHVTGSLKDHIGGIIYGEERITNHECDA